MFNPVARKKAVRGGTSIIGSKNPDTVKPIEHRTRVKRGLTILIKEIINNMMIYVDGYSILKKVCDNHEGDKLGEFRAIVISILDVTTNDLSILQSSLKIFNADAHKQLQIMVHQRLKPVPSNRVKFQTAANKNTIEINTEEIVSRVLKDFETTQRTSLLNMYDFICRGRNASLERQLEIAKKLVPPLPYGKVEHIKYPRSQRILQSNVSFLNKSRSASTEETNRKTGTLTEDDQKLMKQLHAEMEAKSRTNPFSSLQRLYTQTTKATPIYFIPKINK